MMNVPNGRLAGVARYAVEIVGAMSRLSPDTQFDLFVREGFTPPGDWAGRNNVRYRTVRKFRLFRLTAGWRPPLTRMDGWFVPAYDTLSGGLVRQIPMIHDLYPLTHPEWFPDDVVREMQRQIRETAIGRPALANSEHTAKGVREVLGAPPERVVVTPLGPGNLIVQRDRSSVSDEELAAAGAPPGRFLLTLSTLEPRKNLTRLFEALSILRARPGLGDVSLVVAGGKGWKYEVALERLEELKLGDAVRLLGYVDDSHLSALFARCEAYVCASLSEGFGIPVLEAMLAGCPVVTSDGGALPEVGGDAVRYFDPLDPTGIADALDAALAEPEKRDEWVARGLARASTFTWDAAARRTLAAMGVRL